MNVVVWVRSPCFSPSLCPVSSAVELRPYKAKVGGSIPSPGTIYNSMTKIIVNGTFDILHVGHLKLFEYAKSLGDHLTVAIDTDERIKSKKGPSRPVNNQYERKLMLEFLKPVDEVVVFGSDQELIDIIKQYDIMVKGSDYKGKSVIGETYCKQVIYFDRIEEYSTTKKIKSITDRR